MSLRGSKFKHLVWVEVMLISANSVFNVKRVSEWGYEAEYIDNFLALGMHLEGCTMIQFGGRYFCWKKVEFSKPLVTDTKLCKMKAELWLWCNIIYKNLFKSDISHNFEEILIYFLIIQEVTDEIICI